MHKWANLKHIYDALSIFLVEECDQKLPLPGVRPDLKAIAQSGSLVDTIRLLKLLVVAAINCADRIEYLKSMQGLAESTQEVLMTTAQEAGETESADVDDLEEELSVKYPGSSSHGVALEMDLASEERLGMVIADNQRIAQELRELRKRHDDAHDHYAKLQASYEQAQSELKDTKDRLAAVLAGTGCNEIYTDATSNRESVISSLETRVLSAEEETESLRKANEILKIKSEKAQRLQDEFDEMKLERDRLSRKANAAEKYKQKLEAFQELEKENQSLRSRIEDLQDQLKQSDSTALSSSGLQREVEEYRRLLPAIEQERHELNEMRKRLEFDYQTLEARHQDTLEQFARHQGMVEDLRGRLREYEEGVTPTTPKANGEAAISSLDDDFARLADALAHDAEDGENNISEAELAAIVSAMQAQATASSTTEQEMNSQAQKKLMSVLEKSQSRHKQLLHHVQRQSALIRELQARTPASNEQNQPVAAPTSQDSGSCSDPDHHSPSPTTDSKLQEALLLNENLQRELKLMASAWYDQSLRMANNGVLMTGGHPVPELQSFLGRQRKVAENVMLGKKILT